MPKAQIVSQYELNKPTYESEEIKCNSTFVERTYQLTVIDTIDTNRITTCVDQSHTMPAITQNVYDHVFTKPISWQ
jgi:hypothetical protein